MTTVTVLCLDRSCLKSSLSNNTDNVSQQILAFIRSIFIAHCDAMVIPIAFGLGQPVEYLVNGNHYSDYSNLDVIEEAIIRTAHQLNNRISSITDNSNNDKTTLSVSASTNAIVVALTKAICLLNRLQHQETAAGRFGSNHPTSKASANGIINNSSVLNLNNNTKNKSSVSLDTYDARIILIISSDSQQTNHKDTDRNDLHTMPSTVTRGKSTEESISAYSALVSATFHAQRQGIYIDILNISSHNNKGMENPSNNLTEDTDAMDVALRQCAFLTESFYIQVEDPCLLLGYLLGVLGLDTRLRKRHLLNVNPVAVYSVDFRTVCQCHGRLVDLGFACSSCLAVYCGFVPVCRVCKCKFDLRQAKALV